RIRIVVWLRADRGTRAEHGATERAGGARYLGFAGIRDAPTALQRRLAQPKRARRCNNPQLVPAPLQHRRRDLDPPALCFQDSAFGRDRQSDAEWFERQHRLRPSVEQPRLYPHDNRARIGEADGRWKCYHAARAGMHGLKARGISARETGFYLVDLEPRTGRVGIAMDDPN